MFLVGYQRLHYTFFQSESLFIICFFWSITFFLSCMLLMFLAGLSKGARLSQGIHATGMPDKYLRHI